MAKLISSQLSKGHGGIFGITQSGKTHYAFQHFLINPIMSIFVNWQFIPFKFPYKAFTLKNAILLANKTRKVIYNADTKEDVDLLFKTIYEAYKHNNCRALTVYCDEADKYSDEDGLQTLITKGLRYGIQVIVISQRPQMLQNRDILDNLYWLVLFRHSRQFWNTLKERYKFDLSDEQIAHTNTKYNAIYYNYEQVILL